MPTPSCRHARLRASAKWVPRWCRHWRKQASTCTSTSRARPTSRCNTQNAWVRCRQRCLRCPSGADCKSMPCRRSWFQLMKQKPAQSEELRSGNAACVMSCKASCKRPWSGPRPTGWRCNRKHGSISTSWPTATLCMPRIAPTQTCGRWPPQRLSPHCRRVVTGLRLNW